MLRLGDAWNAAIAHYYDAENLVTIAPTEDWYPASIFFPGMKFMLFGDPTLPIDSGIAAIEQDESLVMNESVEAIRAAHEVPALGAIAVRGESIVARGVSGVRIAGGEVVAEQDDLFHIGSCTKAMTATLAAIMVNEGSIEWDTTIADALPDLKDAIDPGYASVTLAQLLSHRSGLAEDRSPDPQRWPKIRALEGDIRAQRIEMVRLVLTSPPAAVPGSTMVYSNAGYVVAGAMLEAAGGDSWENLMITKLLDPLGMTSAGFGAPGESTDREAPDQPWGHRGDSGIAPGPFADNPAVLGPAGTAHCSLEDWAKFARLHLGHKVGELQLDETTLARLHDDPDGDGYALGWGVTERGWGGGRVFSHSGSNTMWFATIWLAPEIDSAYLAATNTGKASAFAACDRAVATLIESTSD